MPVSIPNFKYSYLRKSKPVFVPTAIGRRIGAEIKGKVENAYTFDRIYFHLRVGGHVAAMHRHRDHRLFARIDISRFFYSVSRRRVQSALDRIGIDKPRFYAKWSTVTNPYNTPKYALPYGFVQSPILASLVIATSHIGSHLLSLPATVNAAVYVDDISLSSDNEADLQRAFDSTLAVVDEEGFDISTDKLRPPAPAMDIFNCDLTHGQAKVRAARIAEFLASGPAQPAQAAFTAYCATVEAGNH
jgi:hypothetical protein